MRSFSFREVLWRVAWLLFFFRFNETSPYLIPKPHLINPYAVITTFNIAMSISSARGSPGTFPSSALCLYHIAPKSRDYEWLATPFRHDIIMENSAMDSTSSIETVGCLINRIEGWIERSASLLMALVLPWLHPQRKVCKLNLQRRDIIIANGYQSALRIFWSNIPFNMAVVNASLHWLYSWTNRCSVNKFRTLLAFDIV